MQTPSLRKTRAKPHQAFMIADSAAGGKYSVYLGEIAKVYPTLTPMELRIAALVRAGYKSWEIGNMLGITEHTVENHRTHIRQKIGGTIDGLFGHLLRIC